MSSILAIPQSDYSPFTAQVPHSVSTSPTLSGRGGVTSEAVTVAISEEAYALSARATPGAGDARTSSAEERYAAALAAGMDMGEALSGLATVGRNAEGYQELMDASWTKRNTPVTQTTTSKQGTVIGLTCVADDKSNRAYSLQVTRKDGFQTTFDLDQNVRVNDLEGGGLSIYFAASGITKTYDADGNETIVEGEGSFTGTDGDDILINLNSTAVDAGDGDDVIINLAANAAILGGNGNDAIYTPHQLKGVTYDGGAGDDAILGMGLYDAHVILGEGNDTLAAEGFAGGKVSVTGDGKTTILGQYFRNVDIVNESDTIINANIELLISATVHSNINYKGNSITDSEIITGDADNSIITSSGISRSQIRTGAGNDTIIVNRGIRDSVINVGAGNDTITAISMDYSVIHGGEGDDTITVDRGVGVIRGGAGNDILSSKSPGIGLDGGAGSDTIRSWDRYATIGSNDTWEYYV